MWAVPSEDGGMSGNTFRNREVKEEARAETRRISDRETGREVV